MPATPIAAVVLAAGMGTRMKSDLHKVLHPLAGRPMLFHLLDSVAALDPERQVVVAGARREQVESALAGLDVKLVTQEPQLGTAHAVLQAKGVLAGFDRSEEHTSELQSLMRISYAVFCLKKKNKNRITN